MNNNLLELVMIVKNSGEEIRSTLNAIKDYIDYYTILDTGSTDGTQDMIKDVLSQKKGKLYEEPFIDFATSRNRVLELAGQKCFYTIMLDDTYELHGGAKLRKILKKRKNNKEKAIDLRITDMTALVYYTPRILKTKYNLKYIYRIHECVDCSSDYRYVLEDPDIYLNDIISAYMTQRTKARAINDIKLLQKELEDEPANTRAMFYLGRTYLSCDKIKLGLEWLQKRIDCALIPEKEDEVYDSYFFTATIKDRKLEADWKTEIEPLYIELCNLFPQRAEPLFRLAYHYYQANKFNIAFNYISKAIILPIPVTGTAVESNIYKKEGLYLAAEIAIKQEKFKITETILKKCQLENPNDTRLCNMIYAISNVPRIRGISLKCPTIVFHATENVAGWSPKSKGVSYHKISGTETVLIQLSIEFVKLGYRVFVFGKFDTSDTSNLPNVNTQGTYSGVEYIDCNYYIQFLKKYHVNYLFALRQADNLLYFDTIDNAYLWVHDILPFGKNTSTDVIQTHETKFKKFLCLCKWHRKKVQKEFKLPKDIISITRNAIIPSRFLKPHTKKPFKFIYLSSADRGLNYLIQMIPKVKEKFPETELHLFTNMKILLSETVQQIKKLDYVYPHGIVSQEEISQELLESDVWLYPTDFEETYCIAAVEAQAAGCLCATTSLGSLSEIVGDRGITVKGDISEEKVQDELLKKLFFALENQKIKNFLTAKAKAWALQQTYPKLAQEWKERYLT